MRLLSLIFGLALVSPSLQYIARVPANREDCFFQIVERGEKVWGSFRVTGGGQLDIDLKVTGPDSKTIYQLEKEKEGTFTFIAQDNGNHQLCLSNMMSSVVQKTVNFNLHVGNDLADDGVAKKEHLNPLEAALDHSSMSLQQVHDEQRYLKSRQRRSRKTNASTSSRVFWWSMLEALICIVMGVVQIFYIKSFFDQKNRGRGSGGYP